MKRIVRRSISVGVSLLIVGMVGVARVPAGEDKRTKGPIDDTKEAGASAKPKDPPSPVLRTGPEHTPDASGGTSRSTKSPKADQSGTKEGVTEQDRKKTDSVK